MPAWADADIIFSNANVYTGDERQPRAEAIAVKGDRIIFVGSTREAQRFIAETTRVIDLHGQTVLPGLTDAHCHIFGIGERELNLNLEGARTRADFLAKVEKRFAETEPGRWVTGRGWIETFWDPPTFPTAADLDKVAPGSPVFLTRADGHAAIVNSAALRLAGITAETPAPFGGEILKDKATGQPTGMLIDNAKELVARYIPAASAAEKEDALLRGVKREIELGWCEIQNPGSDVAEVEIMRRLFDTGQLKLRIYNAVSGPGEPADELLTEGASIGTNGGRFTQRTIKFYADGALGSRGAALLQKYADADTSGFLTNKPETLRARFRAGFASWHSGANACHRRPRESHRPRSLRRGIQEGAA